MAKVEHTTFKGEWTSHHNAHEEVWRLTAPEHVFEFRKRKNNPNEPLVITLSPKNDVLEEDAPTIDEELRPGYYDWTVNLQPNGKHNVLSHFTRLRNNLDTRGKRLSNHTTTTPQHVALNRVLLKATMANFTTHPERYWTNAFTEHILSQIPRKRN